MSKRRRRRSEPQPGTQEWAAQSPPGEVFVKHTYEMLLSPAYQNLPWRCEKFLKFLEVQHLMGKGERNGHLVAPYRRLAEAGIHKDGISSAIAEAIRRKLVVMTRKGTYRANARGEPATFRLTYLPTRKGTGGADWELPGHEWRDYNPADTAERKHRAMLESDEILHQVANDS